MTDRITFTISRRRFSEILIGLISLFFASGVVATILKYLWPPSVKAISSEVKIALLDEITTGSVKKFLFNGKAAVLLKMPAGFRAFGSVCTHLGCIAYWKPEENDIFSLPFRQV